MGQKSYDSDLRETGLSILLMVLAFSAFGLAGAAGAAEAEFEGYIDSTALNVRASAGGDSKVIGILLKYDPVTVLDSAKVGSTTWYSITAASGYTRGWVAARFVKRGAAPQMQTPESIDYGAKETPTLMHGPFAYVGAKACQECHEDSVADYPSGAYGVWQGHFHSSAYRTLEKDYTKEIARRARNVDDPASDWRCVKCHVTALGAAPAQLGPGYNEEEGVGCEVCHGPGGRYADEDHGPEIANREAMGFRILRNLDERREVCTSCHNTTSPTFKGFDLRQFSRKIAHWVDDDDDAYRAEAGRESSRRVQAVAQEPKMATKHAVEKAAATTTASAATVADATAAKASAEASASARAAAKAKTEASSRAAQARAEAESARRTAQAKTDAAGQAASAEKAKAEAMAKAEADQRAEAARMAAAEKAERAQAAAQAAEEQARSMAATEAAKANAKAAAATPPPTTPPTTPKKLNPLAHYLDDVDDVIDLNEDGKKYEPFEFPHLKHAGNEYLPNGDCQTCHHAQEDDDSPQACNECHDIDGDAEETKAKKRYAHTKKRPYPMQADQEEVSCVGCHNSMNKLLKAGKREGEKAPTKCTNCHVRRDDE